MASLIRTIPPRGKADGTDYRVRGIGAAYEQFPASAYVRTRRDDDTYIGAGSTPFAEVAAFRAGTRGGGRFQHANVSIAVDAQMGAADIRLTPNEARAFAEAIFLAANEADRLTAAAYRDDDSWLGDEGDTTNGISPDFIAMTEAGS